MRILIAHSFYRLAGGEDRYVRQQLELLRDGHDVELLGRDNSELGGGPSTAARMIASRGEYQCVDETIARMRPDVVHVHNVYPAFGPAVHLAAAKRGVPLVMTVHNFRLRCPNGYMFTEGAPCRRCEGGVYLNAVLHRCFPSRAQSASYATALWIHRFVLRLQDKVTLFITPSEFVRGRLLEWGVTPERVEVVRNCTDVEEASTETGSYGMSVGRLSPEKGIDVLLRALSLAGDPPFKVVGGGPLAAELAALAAELGLTRTVFTGQVTPEEVTRLLRGARYLALPSVWDENAPLAALEALASARPLVVTDTGGLPELVRSGEGFVCEPGDPQSLAAHLRRLAGDDELCELSGRRALTLAQAEFTPRRHRERLEAAYAKVLSPQPVS